ncbi:MAG TPA: non-heme iron oxygenase ferredoxin subunit [Chthoniobacterales bacterium]
MGLRRVCHQSELRPGGVKRLDDVDVAVFNVDGAFLAIKNICTHADLPLSEGELAGETLICPWHGACFSLRTGEALTLPATEPVATFPVVLQGDEVFVEVPA